MPEPGFSWVEALRAPLSSGTYATAASLLALAIRPRLFGARSARSASSPVDLRTLFNASPSVLCLLDGNGAVRAITPNAARVLGEACDRAAELGVTLAELLQPDNVHEAQHLLDDLSRVDHTEPCTWVFKTRGPDGGVRWLEVDGRNLLFDPEVASLFLEIRDVTAEHVLNERHHVLSFALEYSPDAVIVTNAQGFIEYVNPACEHQTGYPVAELRGRSPAILKSDRQPPEFFQRMWQTLKRGEAFRGEIVNRRKNGELYYEDLRIEPVRNGDGEITHFVSTGRDISERKRGEAAADSAAFYDSVTGVSTFRLLRERSRQILALARRHGLTAALLHVDVNNLKSVNQSLGRPIGDELLRKFAERLKQGLRESDALARYEGDEFFILLSDVADDDASARVVRRLRETVTRPYQIKGQTITVDASFGVALYPQDATTFDELQEYATLALKRAQSMRNGHEFYNKEITELTQERLSLEDDLRWAWDHKQFVLHYQPVIAAGTGHVIGAEALARGHIMGLEALARWPHMERGEISPAQFIPVAERTGRIVALDRWAIATATRQAATWASEGWRGWVSVNLSARSLHDPDLPDYIARCLETNNVEPGHLILEITESSAMRDTEVTARVLSQLKDSGALIALDDFGVGHSSLAYLKHFPVDILKLDRHFVHDIGREVKHEHLIETMITFAHKIGAQVVAEGVEHDNQFAWLRQAGCDFVQGYLIGRPRPAEIAFAINSNL
jgi:diguanylate cyclase (GGDEF)-like protein/PAS domain S-box-containing protein